MRAIWIMGLTFVLAGGANMFGIATAEELKVVSRSRISAWIGRDGKTYKLSDYHGKQRLFWPVFRRHSRRLHDGVQSHGRSARAENTRTMTWPIDRQRRQTRKEQAVRSVGRRDYPISKRSRRRSGSRVRRNRRRAEMGKPLTFFIGKDGHILFIDKNVRPSTHADDVAAKLKGTWHSEAAISETSLAVRLFSRRTCFAAVSAAKRSEQVRRLNFSENIAI